MSKWVRGVQSVRLCDWFAKCPNGSVESKVFARAIGLPNVKLCRWIPYLCAIVSKLFITRNKAIPSSSSQCHLCLHARLFVNWDLLEWYFDCAFSEAILVTKYLGMVLLRWELICCMLNVMACQMSNWVSGSNACTIVSCLCMYSKLFITGNKAIPSSSSRWHLCLHARLFVNWDLLGWYFGCVFSETILVKKYLGMVLLR